MQRGAAVQLAFHRQLIFATLFARPLSSIVLRTEAAGKSADW
ncbi:MAG: hypothetical protein WKF71_08155 [Pyrinomonadaceae bacterium]